MTLLPRELSLSWRNALLVNRHSRAGVRPILCGSDGVLAWGIPDRITGPGFIRGWSAPSFLGRGRRCRRIPGRLGRIPDGVSRAWCIPLRPLGAAGVGVEFGRSSVRLTRVSLVDRVVVRGVGQPGVRGPGRRSALLGTARRIRGWLGAWVRWRSVRRIPVGRRCRGVGSMQRVPDRLGGARGVLLG